MNSRRAVATVALVLYIALAAALGWVGLEGNKLFHPKTHKKEVAAADLQAQQVAKDAAEAQAKLAADVAANKAALASQQAELAAVKHVAQEAAGFVSGAQTALAGEESPSVGVKVAAILVNDAANTLPPATAAQVKAYQIIVEQMKADNARLSAALIQKEHEAEVAKAAASQSAEVAAVAVKQAALSDSEARLASAKVEEGAKQAAAALSKLDAKVSDEVTFAQRLEALGIGGGVLLFIVLPLLALAFPGLAPILRGLCAPVLKLWHEVHDREKALVADLHAEATAEAEAIKAKLAREIESHSDTKEKLLKAVPTG